MSNTYNAGEVTGTGCIGCQTEPHEHVTPHHTASLSLLLLKIYKNKLPRLLSPSGTNLLTAASSQKNITLVPQKCHYFTEVGGKNFS